MSMMSRRIATRRRPAPPKRARPRPAHHSRPKPAGSPTSSGRPGSSSSWSSVAPRRSLWWLYADRLVERSVEADGRLARGRAGRPGRGGRAPTDGSIRLTGLQVTNPNAPMTNLFEAEEILVDLLLEPLLTKKVVVQDLVVTGVRFNTPRETSGALENPDPETGGCSGRSTRGPTRSMLPPLSLEGLSTVVRTDAISTDSLRTVQHARAMVEQADSLREGWEDRIESLDPRPRIDSLQAVVQRLEASGSRRSTRRRSPGWSATGGARSINLTSLQDEIAALDDEVRGGVQSLRSGVSEFEELRAAGPGLRAEAPEPPVTRRARHLPRHLRRHGTPG
jgi:hypothetical protein